MTTERDEVLLAAVVHEMVSGEERHPEFTAFANAMEAFNITSHDSYMILEHIDGALPNP